MSHDVHHAGEHCVLIDPTVCLTPVLHHDGADLAGFHLAHEISGQPELEWCTGYVRVQQEFAGERPFWKMTGSLAGGDLTLSPSILCHGLGGLPEFHGYITDGRWVPA